MRRGLVLGAVLAMTGLLTPACGTESGRSGPVTLEVWDFSTEQVDFHNAVIDQFNLEHPTIKVNWRSIPQAEYREALPRAFHSGEAPDIFYWSDDGPLNMAHLLAQQWIKPLHPDGTPPSEFRLRWPDGSFVDGINVHDGTIYGFPFSENLYWGPGYMYLNKEVFAAAKLDPNKPPTTWSQLKQACAKIKSATQAECIAAPAKGRELQRIWFALAAGAMTDQFFDYRNGKFALSDPKLLETFAFLQELKLAGYLAPGTNDKNVSRQQFADGQAAIYLDGTWMPSVWTSQGFRSDRYTVAAHPNPDGGATGALARQHDGNKYWISSQTEHHDAAWKLVEWMTRPDGVFVQEYFEAGFGTLAFTNNTRWVTDPAIRQLMRIAEQPGFRVHVPVPVLKCPDIAKSTAYLDAISKRPDWEYEIMVEALVANKDLGPAARELVAERQRILETKLIQEAATGLQVSMDCYTFSDWNYTTDYGLDRYGG